MGSLVVIIALELVFAGGIVGFSSHKLPNVLGIHKIAQVDDTSPPPDTSTQDTPSTTENNPPDQPSTGESSSPDSQTNLFEQDINPTATQKGQEANSLSNPESQGHPNNSVETNTSQTQVILSPDDLINSPENIDDKSISKAKKEDDQITQATNPLEQTNLLINFATDKVKDMNNFIKSDDFSSTNFAASRFNEQIHQAIGNLEKLSPKDQVKLKKQLVNFCNQADQILRTVQLSVPEESEQDLQIARGQCMELQL